MPSTHSAVIMYYATYVPLACLYLPLHPSLPPGWLSITLPWVVVVPCASLIAVSRTWLGHHTWAQVGVGCLYGVLFAFLWFTSWTAGLNEYGAIVERAFESFVGVGWS